tara:strand:- start:486 stop:1268 length:783 start_codon:yes stop_codon:yes gene_type:complete
MGSLGTLPDPLDINDRTDTTITAADEIVYADATDSAAIKKDTVQGILDLVPAVADNAITLAKMASGTDGNIISYDASGDPVAIATGSDGQVLTSAGAGAPPAFEALPGGGKVGQVLSVLKTDTFTLTSTSYADITDMTIAITPSATNSKVLVTVHLMIGNAGNTGLRWQILRGSTAVAIGDAASSRIRGTFGSTSEDSNETGYQSNIMYLDSPNTTDATTYKLQCSSRSNQIRVNHYGSDTDSGNFTRGVSTITVMEILA